MRIENATLRDRLNSHQLEVDRRDRIIGELEARAGALEVQLKGAEKELETARDGARGGEMQVGLLKQEVAMLKRHLVRIFLLSDSSSACTDALMSPQESYSTEEAIQHAGNYDTQKTARLAELDELLEVHKRELAKATQEVAHWRGLVERYGGNTTEIIELEEREKRNGEAKGKSAEADKVAQSLQEQLRLNEELQQGAFISLYAQGRADPIVFAELDEARNELALMEQEVDSLSAQIEQLEENQGIRGAYNPATTKVLEFRDSPDRVEHAIRSATLERLQAENRALLARLSDLDRGSVAQGGQSLVPRESLATAQAEIEKLKAAVAQKETMMKRIHQVHCPSTILPHAQR